MEHLPKRTILSPATPGSRTPEEFRRAVELVLAKRSAYSGKGAFELPKTDDAKKPKSRKVKKVVKTKKRR
jgi:hypothetical protein